jgi:hypothetical protein
VKNQYFGDINDYLKYGLLRGLRGSTGLRLTVCWMLTPDVDKPDGRRTQYLEDPDRWSMHDPKLFAALRDAVLTRGERSVKAAAGQGILPAARFISPLVPDDQRQRAEWAADVRLASATADLIFFDPDNGMQVRSVPPGRRGSSKYLLWAEVAAAFGDGHSLLIYQHFPHRKREPFIRELAGDLVRCAGAPEAYVFRTPHVGFFLLLQERHRAIVGTRVEVISRNWAPHIVLVKHRITESGR